MTVLYAIMLNMYMQLSKQDLPPRPFIKEIYFQNEIYYCSQNSVVSETYFGLENSRYEVILKNTTVKLSIFIYI